MASPIEAPNESSSTAWRHCRSERPQVDVSSNAGKFSEFGRPRPSDDRTVKAFRANRWNSNIASTLGCSGFPVFFGGGLFISIFFRYRFQFHFMHEWPMHPSNVPDLTTRQLHAVLAVAEY